MQIYINVHTYRQTDTHLTLTVGVVLYCVSSKKVEKKIIKSICQGCCGNVLEVAQEDLVVQGEKECGNSPAGRGLGQTDNRTALFF